MVYTMYKKTEEIYILDNRDKLVMTFDDGKIMLLINNNIKVNPKDVRIRATSSTCCCVEGKLSTKITSLEIGCTVEV